MAFQDFGLITERRKAEKRQRLRKRIIIGVSVSITLVVLIVVGAFSVIHFTKKDPKGEEAQQDSGFSIAEKTVKSVCSVVDYKEKCESSLKSVVSKNSSMSQQKDLIKAAISLASEEMNRAYDSIKSFKFDTREDNGAFDDCKDLLGSAKEELEESYSKVSPSRAHDVNSWLSAVIYYTQTCIDGFPNGKSKTKMQDALNAAKQLTSNSLAIVTQVSSILPIFQSSKTNRRLLETNDDHTPSWMSYEERRMLKGHDDKIKANVIVAKDGSGAFNTISAALEAMPKDNKGGRYTIYVKAGIYDETVTVEKNMVNVTMYGDGSQKTIITGKKNFIDGVRTFQTATFVALGEGFIARSIGFRNTAGPEKHQAVAARIQADRSIFLNCRFEGYQDTLYAQTHRQFYRSCVILGTIDFIFGDAAAIFQNCMIMARRPMDNQQNIVTAQGRVDRHETTGIVLQNCNIKADKQLEPVKSQFKTYLGRPWKDYSRTIVMESTIDDIVHPDGWLPWDQNKFLDTLHYAEFNNHGPGASTRNRVKWAGYKGVIRREEAMKFTAGSFLQGSWIKNAAVPVRFGLYR